jgi:hypothetical protein
MVGGRRPIIVNEEKVDVNAELECPEMQARHAKCGLEIESGPS